MIVAVAVAVLFTGVSLLALSAAIGTLLALIGLRLPGPKQVYTWVGIMANGGILVALAVGLMVSTVFRVQ
jgi:hypothetical protein